MDNALNVKKNYEATACKHLRNAVELHTSDIRFYGMGEAFAVEIIAAMGAAGGSVDVQVAA